MDKFSMTKEELDAMIEAAVNTALDTYISLQRKDVLIPRLRAAQLLHKNVSTLWRWSQSSYLIPIRRGRSVLYKACDLARLGAEV